MAATCTVTQPATTGRKGKIHQVKWSWKSHTDGSVAAVGSSNAISGFLRQVRFRETTAVSSAGSLPSSGYDVTLVDGDNFDWLMGLGANIPNSNADVKCLFNIVNSMGGMPQLSPYLDARTLTPAITNAGNTKLGEIVLTVENPAGK